MKTTLHLAAVLLLPISQVLADLRVQIVNDNDALPSPSLLFVGTGVTLGAGNIPVRDLQNTQAKTSLPIGNLTQSTVTPTVVSPLTGKTRKVYEFSLKEAAGGVLYAFQKPFTYSKAAPSPTLPQRFDKMEVSFSASTNAGGADLTSIDFLSIPMSMEVIPDFSSPPADTMTFYSPLGKILGDLVALKPATMPKAILPAGWTAAGDPGFAKFQRILGPGQMTQKNVTANGTASLDPYPSFGSYLALLAGSGKAFTIAGSGNFAKAPLKTAAGATYYTIPAYGASYSYLATVKSDGKSPAGYTVELVKDAVHKGMYAWVDGSNPPKPHANPAPLPADADITIHLQAVTKANGNSSYDFIITGAVLNETSFGVSPGLNPATAPQGSGVSAVQWFNDTLGNSIYSQVVGDVLAGLNFGYLGGNPKLVSDDSSQWYSEFPQAFPFGAARPVPDDGHYHQYAAELYNESDAYGFAFNDRGGRPSPLVHLDNTSGTLRVTLLPDKFLAAPKVGVVPSLTKPTELTLQWAAVPAATSYVVDVDPDVAGSPFTVVGATQKTVQNLKPGTPYVFLVKAVSGNTRSPVLPFQASTSGNLTAASGPIKLPVSLNWGLTSAPPAGLVAAINGQTVPLNNSANPKSGWTNGNTTAKPGPNAFGVQLRNARGDILFNNVAYVSLSGDNSRLFVTAPDPVFAGVTNPVYFAPAPPGNVNGGTYPQGPFLGAKYQVVMQLSFSPAPIKKFSPVTAPAGQLTP